MVKRKSQFSQRTVTKSMGKAGEKMENGRKKIWICLLAVILAAVVIGLLCYLSTPQEQAGEGFLIRRAEQVIDHDI